MTEDSSEEIEKLKDFLSRDKVQIVTSEENIEEIAERTNLDIEELVNGGESSASTEDTQSQTGEHSVNDGVEPPKPNPDAVKYQCGSHCDKEYVFYWHEKGEDAKEAVHGFEETGRPIVSEKPLIGCRGFYQPLFSAGTIQEIIQQKKEEMGDKPSQFDRLDRNAWKERRQTLEELEEVFSEE